METHKELFDRLLPSACLIARGIYRRLPSSVQYDDVEAAARMGLWQAVTSEACAGHTNIEVYVRIRVRGAIKDELRRQDWLPRRARASGAVVGVMLCDDLESLFFSCESVAEDAVHESQKQAALTHALGKLPARDRLILERLLSGVSQCEIAEEFKISAPRISQLTNRATTVLAKSVKSYVQARPPVLQVLPEYVVSKAPQPVRHRRVVARRRYKKWDLPTPKDLMAEGLSKKKARAVYANSLYMARQALGLCGSCNAPALPGRKKCEAHTPPKSRYASYVAAGLCTACGTTPEPGKTGCTRCLSNRAKARARAVARLKEQGLCVTCGLTPADPPTVRCVDCKHKRKTAPKGVAHVPSDRP